MPETKSLNLCCKYLKKQSFVCNRHSAEITVISLVERSAIYLLVFHITREKQTLKPKKISILTLHW